jgi:hypothetical protein
MNTNINTLLLYIFIILLIYCIMYTFIYNDKVVTFDNTNNIKKTNNTDKFMNILESEGDQYLYELNNLQQSSQNMLDTDISSISNIITNIKGNQTENNNKIIDNLTEIFFKRCLEYVNNKNAIVYNEFLKYDNPSKNKYYQQYV